MTSFEDPSQLHVLLTWATADVDSPDLPARALEVARRRRQARRRALLTGGAVGSAAALIIVAWLGLNLSSQDHSQIATPSTANTSSTPAASHPPYKVNRFGLTVGPVLISTPPSEWPDLRAIRFHGRRGYLRVRTSRAAALGGSTPEQAVAHMRSMCRQGLLDDQGRIWAKVYKADGKTVLGKMLAGRTSARC